MKKLLLSTAALASAVVFAAEEAKPAAAAEAKPAAASEKADAEAAANAEEADDSGAGPWVEVGVDVLSDYVWRGIILDDNVVWQPSMSIGYNTEDWGGLYFNYWASLDFTNRRNRMPYGLNSRQCMSIQEQDFYIGYTKSFGNLDTEIGYYWYDYPYNGPNHCAGHLGQDLYFGTFYNNDWITPGFEVLWACGTYNGHDPSTLYLRFSAKHEFAITDKLTITPKATMGVGDHAFTQGNIAYEQYDNCGTEITDQTTSLKVAYAVTDWFSVSATLNYTWIPSHTLRQADWLTYGHDSRNQLLWGGVNATLSF